MGLTSKKQKDIPEELQPFPPEFEGIPSPQSAEEIKAFMNVNEQ